jgi:hypothetical protein
MTGPYFESWEHENLVKFAKEAYEKLQKQEEGLQELRLLLAAEREACAKVAESYEPRCDTCPSGVANAIRARGQQ